MKLQDAYASESNKAGTWKNIGYVAPGASAAGDNGTTTNFTYTGSIASDVDIKDDMADQEKAWEAENNVALNDCKISAGAWAIKVKAASNGNSLKYEATTACAELTPSFEKIGQ